jgi:ADP-ribose pyrophosphatase
MQVKVEYAGNFLTVLSTEEDGQTYEFVRKASAAVMIAKDVRNGIEYYCLGRVRRTPVGLDLWEFPAGHIEPAETPKEAATRELREEIGYEAGRRTYLGASFTSPGYSDEKHYFFLMNFLEKCEGITDELSEVHWHTLPELLEMVKTSQIIDSKTILGIGYLVFDKYAALVEAPKRR